MRWAIGLGLVAATVVGVNLFFLYVALENPVQVVDSYKAVPR